MALGTRFDDALVYAADAHRTQTRKSTEIPYLGHLLGVASIAIDHGASEDEAIAALLHDVAEDQGGAARLADVRRRYGDAVANVVAGCSDSLAENPEAKRAWRERKRDYLHHLGETDDPSILLVSAADKLHNLRSMLSDYAVAGERLWARFNPDAGKIGVLQYYRSLVRAYERFCRRSGDSRVARIAAELASTLTRLEEASGATRELGVSELLEA